MKRFIEYVKTYIKDTNIACKSEQFNQYKYDIYKEMILLIIISSVFSSFLYWFTDCQIVNDISFDTLLPRLSPLLSLCVFYVIYRKFDSYAIVMPAAYVVLHSIMWATIWSIVYLPDKSHAREGFIIMHLMFIDIGYMASYHQSFVGHTLVFVDIIVSNEFNHYDRYPMMLSLCILCIVSVEVLLFLANNGLYDRYKTKCTLEWLSYHDQLTGLYNRNIFKDVERFNQDVLSDKSWILLFDVDFFKKINDEYGHLEGDVVLKGISDMLMESVSSYDGIVLRWGGEEFMIITFESSYDNVTALAEEVRLRVQDCLVFCCPVTISCGIAPYVKSFHATTRCADEALYDAKTSGRNCIRFIKH